jgi:beta-galactosidase
VVLSPDKTILTPDGKDVTIVNITITDDKGREIPTADNLVKFYLSGDAKIIGVGNGDPSSHEPDKCPDGAWQRSAFNGKCQMIILAGKTTGTLKLEAKANGLQPASTTITLVK